MSILGRMLLARLPRAIAAAEATGAASVAGAPAAGAAWAPPACVQLRHGFGSAAAGAESAPEAARQPLSRSDLPGQPTPETHPEVRRGPRPHSPRTRAAPKSRPRGARPPCTRGRARSAHIWTPQHLPSQLLRPGDVTIGITAREYEDRRRRLARALPRGAVAVLPASSTAFVTGVIPYVSGGARAGAAVRA